MPLAKKRLNSEIRRILTPNYGVPNQGGGWRWWDEENAAMQWEQRVIVVCGLRFSVGKQYPFSPPKVTIGESVNSIDYLQYRAGVSSTVLGLPHNQECLCCSSVLCAGNWSPSVVLESVLLEHRILQKRLREHYAEWWLDRFMHRRGIRSLLHNVAEFLGWA